MDFPPEAPRNTGDFLLYLRTNYREIQWTAAERVIQLLPTIDVNAATVKFAKGSEQHGKWTLWAGDPNAELKDELKDAINYTAWALLQERYR